MRSFSASRLAIRPVAAETHSHFCERSEDPILASRFATDMMVILDPLALNGSSNIDSVEQSRGKRS